VQEFTASLAVYGSECWAMFKVDGYRLVVVWWLDLTCYFTGFCASLGQLTSIDLVSAKGNAKVN